MKAMLEPRIVATSTEILASALQGAPAAPDRMTTSSQGVLMWVMDAVPGTLGSGDMQSDEQNGAPLNTSPGPSDGRRTSRFLR
jgi:hypothetical protein